MTDENHGNENEPALAELFDRTASPLSAEARVRVLARARDIASAKRGGVLRTIGVWAPALAAAAAVAYLAVPARHGSTSAGDRATPSAMTAVASGPATAPSTTVAAPAEPTAEEDPVLAVFDDEPSDVEPFDLGPLMGERDGRGTSMGMRGRVSDGPMPERSAR